MRKLILLFTGIFFTYVFVSSCNKEQQDNTKPIDESQSNETQLLQNAKAIFAELPNSMPGSEKDTPALIELGKKLFFETKLSANGTQSCNSCHDVTGGNAGVDNKPTSEGAFKGKFGNRNSPTVLNAGFHFVQFWDGRAANLKEQAKGPILNPVEMAMKDEKSVVKVISADKEYKEMFAKAYPELQANEQITYDNIAEAIAAYERTFVSKSRFDDYLAGVQDALNENEQKGLNTFMGTGCNTCHSGALLGGNMYQKMGLMNPYETNDEGRFEATKNEADKHFFKVPSLRNITKTAPYFHNGSVSDLNEAVKQMAWLQLNKKLSDQDVQDIVAFLGALTDKKIEKGESFTNK